MNKDKYALLVIDMQLVAFDGQITPPIANGSQILGRVSTLIGYCRSKELPVIYTQTCAFPGQPYSKDVHGWEIHPDVAPLADERIVFKVGPSGFENPELDHILAELDVGRLIVCGIWSEGCVAITCESALEHGYDVYLAADAHGTVRNSDEEAALVVAEQNDKLEQRKVIVLKTGDIESHLGRANFCS